MSIVDQDQTESDEDVKDTMMADLMDASLDFQTSSGSSSSPSETKTAALNQQITTQPTTSTAATSPTSPHPTSITHPDPSCAPYASPTSTSTVNFLTLQTDSVGVMSTSSSTTFVSPDLQQPQPPIQTASSRHPTEMPSAIISKPIDPVVDADNETIGLSAPSVSDRERLLAARMDMISEASSSTTTAANNNINNINNSNNSNGKPSLNTVQKLQKLQKVVDSSSLSQLREMVESLNRKQKHLVNAIYTPIRNSKAASTLLPKSLDGKVRTCLLMMTVAYVEVWSKSKLSRSVY
jgi:hypothetical protein